MELSTLPDYDIRIPLLKHRGPPTIYFGVVVAVITAVGGGVVVGLLGAIIAGLGGAVAIGSHLAADALTPAGVDPFRNGQVDSYELARSNSTIANYGLLGLGVVAAGLALVIGQTLATLV